MSAHDIRDAHRPPFDAVLQSMADYLMDYDAGQSALAMETARYCLMDSLACALLALDYPECTKLLGPVVPGATLAGGTRVPGTRAPPASVAPGTTGPSSLVHSG